MNAFAVVATVIGLALLVAVTVELITLRRRVTALQRLVAERPPPLDAETSRQLMREVMGEATDQIVRAVVPVPEPLALPTRAATGDAGHRPLSGPRIKASSWVAGASETVRRLREGAG
ncbi:MAG: hypothetical protein ACK5OX_02550 [Desertimonas sp.]